MTDEARPPPSTLKGRLADVYVPALVSGSVEALSRRLGNRATVDDPTYGRASSLVSLDPMIKKVSSWLAERRASYRHVYSTTGVDRDTCEGVFAMTVDGTSREVPVAVVAERRRLREIELRVYYRADSGNKSVRSPLVPAPTPTLLPQMVAGALEAVRTGSVDEALEAFEEGSVATDPDGARHAKRDGAMASFFARLGALDFAVFGMADDGRSCCLEGTAAPEGRETPAVVTFERGDSGLFRELRLYWG